MGGEWSALKAWTALGVVVVAWIVAVILEEWSRPRE